MIPSIYHKDAVKRVWREVRSEEAGILKPCVNRLDFVKQERIGSGESFF